MFFIIFISETTGADETENTEEVKDTDAEDAEDVKDSDAEGTKDTGAESADHTKKTPLPNTPEFPQDTRRKKKPQPAGSLPEGSAAIHSILTSVVASADGIPGEINVKI